MKSPLLILLLLIVIEGNSQLQKNEISFTSNEDAVTKSKSIKGLRKKSDLVIAYRRYTTWNFKEPFDVIVVKQDEVFKGYKFSLPNLLVERVENVDTLKSILKLFYDYDLFAMTKTDNWMETCNNSAPGCGDCEEYDFIIMTKDKVKRLYFYAPEMYVNYCPTVKANERVIGLINRLWK